MDQRMHKLKELPLPSFFTNYYNFEYLTPIQAKSVQAGLLEAKSQLVCAPTASGKTLVATMAIASQIPQGGKAIYLVPLRALANEKYQEYKKLLENTPYQVTIATGDVDSPSQYLSKYDLLILTTEKLDSLIRHRARWLNQVSLVVIDEIHLLQDPSRGPTLEVVLTILKQLIKPQLVGLSATIGNPKALASWLEATLVEDSWRPVELKQGIFETETEKTTFF